MTKPSKPAKRTPTLGRSPVTGMLVAKPVTRSALDPKRLREVVRAVVAERAS